MINFLQSLNNLSYKKRIQINKNNQIANLIEICSRKAIINN